MELKKYIDFGKTIMNKYFKKKVIQNSLIVIIFGIILLIAGGSIWDDNKEATNTDKLVQEEVPASKLWGASNKTETEERIEEILSKISGVGSVSVMITYSESKEQILAYEIKNKDSVTEEKDSGGGSRKIASKDEETKTIYEDDQGNLKKPIIIKEVYPKISGVVVVAEGAKNEVVKDKLFRATQALLEVQAHKIMIFEMDD